MTTQLDLLRIDPLTGCQNFLGFLEACLNVSISDMPVESFTDEVVENTNVDQGQFSAILFVDINDLSGLNDQKGRVFSDSVIHWVGILLKEESDGPVFRLGGDEFAVLLKADSHETYSRYMDRLLERMDREAKQFGILGSPADIALILYDSEPISLDTILLQMGEAMVKVKYHENGHSMVFKSCELQFALKIPQRRRNGEYDVSYAARWLSLKNIYQVLEMGRRLDRAQQDAFTDGISNLPNMRAALLNLDRTLQDSAANNKPYSLLMIDGDNIHAYNNINYAAGDGMIRDMSEVFKKNLRPSDFIARWRTGDEFLVILPETSAGDAAIIGERFRLAVKEASQAWKFPVTISIGVASYPIHGETVDALIDQVEAANKQAKSQGKDQVVVAG